MVAVEQDAQHVYAQGLLQCLTSGNAEGCCSKLDPAAHAALQLRVEKLDADVGYLASNPADSISNAVAAVLPSIVFLQFLFRCIRSDRRAA